MKKKYYILSSFIISIILLLGIQSKVYAASVSISASGTNIEKGQTITINADIKEASSWELDLSTTGGNLSKSDSRVGNTDSGNNESKTVKIGTFSANEAGIYTITLSGYVVDGGTLAKVTASGKVEITVTNPPPVTTPTTTTTEKDSKPVQPSQPKVLEFTSVNENVYVTGTVNVRKSYNSNSEKLGQLKVGDSVTRTGVSKSAGEDGNRWSKITYNGTTAYVISSKLTTTKPVEEPEQPVEEPIEAQEVETTDENQEIKGGLKSLEIEGLTISPSFNPNVYEYRVIVKEDLSELPINAVPDIEGATVTIAGNKNLAEGENLITIIVYNENSETATYQITTNKSTIDLTETDKMLKQGTEEAKRNVIIFIVALAIAMVALIGIMVLKHKNENKEENKETSQGKQEFTDKEEIVENTQEETNQDEPIKDKKEKKKGKHF